MKGMLPTSTSPSELSPTGGPRTLVPWMHSSFSDTSSRTADNCIDAQTCSSSAQGTTSCSSASSELPETSPRPTDAEVHSRPLFPSVVFPEGPEVHIPQSPPSLPPRRSITGQPINSQESISPASRPGSLQLGTAPLSAWRYLEVFNPEQYSELSQQVAVATHSSCDLDEAWQGTICPSDPVSRIMSTPVQSISKNATQQDALQMMDEHNISALLVDTGGDPGFITRRDFLKSDLWNLSCTSVHEGMTQPVVYVDASTPIATCSQLLHAIGLRRVAVYDASRADPTNTVAAFVGMVSDRDILDMAQPPTAMASTAAKHRRSRSITDTLAAAENKNDAEGRARDRMRAAVQLWEIDFKEIEMEDKCLGRGSFGEVYLGTHQGTKVAIKRLHVQTLQESGGAGPLWGAAAQPSEDDMRYFLKEMEIMASLRHPNVVLFIGACLTPPNVCLVTEFCVRRSLDHVLYKSGVTLDLARKLSLMVDLASGMLSLHSQHPPIIHCDLKPANVLVTRSWEAKVTDFGLSRIKHRASMVNSRAGMEGTMEYCAPEVLRGEHYTEKADVHSFGVVLWELLKEEQPFLEENGNRFVLIMKLGSGELRLPPLEPPIASARLCGLVNRCMSFDPNLRPSFKEILGVLQEEHKLVREATPPPVRPPVDIGQVVRGDSATSLQRLRRESTGDDGGLSQGGAPSTPGTAGARPPLAPLQPVMANRPATPGKDGSRPPTPGDQSGTPVQMAHSFGHPHPAMYVPVYAIPHYTGMPSVPYAPAIGPAPIPSPPNAASTTSSPASSTMLVLSPAELAQMQASGTAPADPAASGAAEPPPLAPPPPPPLLAVLPPIPPLPPAARKARTSRSMAKRTRSQPLPDKMDMLDVSEDDEDDDFEPMWAGHGMGPPPLRMMMPVRPGMMHGSFTARHNPMGSWSFGGVDAGGHHGSARAAVSQIAEEEGMPGPYGPMHGMVGPQPQVPYPPHLLLHPMHPATPAPSGFSMSECPSVDTMTTAGSVRGDLGSEATPSTACSYVFPQSSQPSLSPSTSQNVSAGGYVPLAYPGGSFHMVGWGPNGGPPIAPMGLAVQDAAGFWWAQPPAYVPGQPAARGSGPYSVQNTGSSTAATAYSEPPDAAAAAAAAAGGSPPRAYGGYLAPQMVAVPTNEWSPYGRTPSETSQGPHVNDSCMAHHAQTAPPALQVPQPASQPQNAPVSPVWPPKTRPAFMPSNSPFAAHIEEVSGSSGSMSSSVSGSMQMPIPKPTDSDASWTSPFAAAGEPALAPTPFSAPLPQEALNATTTNYVSPFSAQQPAAAPALSPFSAAQPTAASPFAVEAAKDTKPYASPFASAPAGPPPAAPVTNPTASPFAVAAKTATFASSASSGTAGWVSHYAAAAESDTITSRDSNTYASPFQAASAREGSTVTLAPGVGSPMASLSMDDIGGAEVPMQTTPAQSADQQPAPWQAGATSHGVSGDASPGDNRGFASPFDSFHEREEAKTATASPFAAHQAERPTGYASPFAVASAEDTVQVKDADGVRDVADQAAVEPASYASPFAVASTEQPSGGAAAYASPFAVGNAEQAPYASPFAVGNAEPTPYASPFAVGNAEPPAAYASPFAVASAGASADAQPHAEDATEPAVPVKPDGYASPFATANAEEAADTAPPTALEPEAPAYASPFATANTDGAQEAGEAQPEQYASPFAVASADAAAPASAFATELAQAFSSKPSKPASFPQEQSEGRSASTPSATVTQLLALGSADAALEAGRSAAALVSPLASGGTPGMTPAPTAPGRIPHSPPRLRASPFSHSAISDSSETWALPFINGMPDAASSMQLNARTVSRSLPNTISTPANNLQGPGPLHFAGHRTPASFASDDDEQWEEGVGGEAARRRTQNGWRRALAKVRGLAVQGVVPKLQEAASTKVVHQPRNRRASAQPRMRRESRRVMEMDAAAFIQNMQDAAGQPPRARRESRAVYDYDAAGFMQDAAGQPPRARRDSRAVYDYDAAAYMQAVQDATGQPPRVRRDSRAVYDYDAAAAYMQTMQDTTGQPPRARRDSRLVLDYDGHLQTLQEVTGGHPPRARRDSRLVMEYDAPAYAMELQEAMAQHARQPRSRRDSRLYVQYESPADGAVDSPSERPAM